MYQLGIFWHLLSPLPCTLPIPFRFLRAGSYSLIGAVPEVYPEILNVKLALSLFPGSSQLGVLSVRKSKNKGVLKKKKLHKFQTKLIIKIVSFCMVVKWNVHIQTYPLVS